MRRLFLALWPDAATRAQVYNVAAQLPLSRRQRVRAENLHVTLVFIGSVADELLLPITQLMANVEAHVFALQFDSLSFWRKPRILCLTCSRPDVAVSQLVAQLSAPLAALDIKLDSRPYCPHITIARHVTVKPEFEFVPLAWRAQRFALVESISTRDGVIYQPLQHWRLAS